MIGDELDVGKKEGCFVEDSSGAILQADLPVRVRRILVFIDRAILFEACSWSNWLVTVQRFGVVDPEFELTCSKYPNPCWGCTHAFGFGDIAANETLFSTALATFHQVVERLERLLGFCWCWRG